MKAFLSMITLSALLTGCREETPNFRSTVAGTWSEHPEGFQGIRFTLSQDQTALRGKGVVYTDTGPDYEHSILVTGSSSNDMVTLILSFDNSRQESRTYRRMLTRFDTVYLEPLNTNQYRVLIRQDEMDRLIKRGHNQAPEDTVRTLADPQH